MNLASRYLTFVAMVVLAGCASLGLPQPQSFNQRLVVAYSTVTAVYNTTTVLVERGSMSGEEAVEVIEQADDLREGLDAARELYVFDHMGAEGRLQQVIVALQALDAYLRGKQ